MWIIGLWPWSVDYIFSLLSRSLVLMASACDDPNTATKFSALIKMINFLHLTANLAISAYISANSQLSKTRLNSPFADPFISSTGHHRVYVKFIHHHSPFLFHSSASECCVVIVVALKTKNCQKWSQITYFQDVFRSTRADKLDKNAKKKVNKNQRNV